jgi:GAF domain-containing protein
MDEGELGDRVRRLEDRLRILSGAMRAFAEATTDYVRIFDVVARTVAETIGDGCVVRLMSSEGWLEPVAIHLPFDDIREPAAAEHVRAHIAAPRRLSEHAGARTIMDTGDALLIPHLDLTQVGASMTPEMVDAYRVIGIHSLLLVALRLRGESIGILSMFRFRPEAAPFDDQDRHLAQALADHAALAIANARLVHRLEDLVTERTAELKVLRGLLPICAWCKRIRDDDRGSWDQLEAYVAEHTDTVFTHGICPDCAARALPRRP